MIVVTVAYERERANIEACGADAVFPKPIEAENVLAVLRACGMSQIMAKD